MMRPPFRGPIVRDEISPRVFETQVSTSTNLDGFSVRFATWDEAMRGHGAIGARLREELAVASPSRAPRQRIGSDPVSRTQTSDA